MSKDSQKCSYCKETKLLEDFSLNKKGKYYKECNNCRTKYKCDICSFTCSRQSSYNRHKESAHLNIKNFKCDICEKEFYGKETLKAHVESVHDKIKRFKCEICNKKFSQKANLQTHVKLKHYKIKDYQCSICEVKFCTLAGLQGHIKSVHDKIKDFECSICNHKFSEKGNLAQHIRVKHDKIKNFHCFKCNFKSFGKSGLNAHQKICTGKETMSSGEYKVKKALESLNIPFEREVSEIKTEKNWLRFDFKININNCTKYIEYDGKQHFMPIRFGGISPEKAQQTFERTKLNDKLKNDWCKENNYELLRISYKEFDNVDSLVKEFVNYSIN